MQEPDGRFGVVASEDHELVEDPGFSMQLTEGTAAANSFPNPYILMLVIGSSRWL
ncbi:MAG: hypothetical protein QXT77_01580 [Candidatus Methanomethylicaceae archaeon]